MSAILGPTLELTVLLPGMLLAYLPVIPCLKQSPRRLAAWLAPLLLALCILGGMLCRALECPTRPVLFALLPPAMMLYHKTLRISLWKSVSIFLAVCAVFACVNSFCRAINAVLAGGLPPSRAALWFQPAAGILYNGICLLFLLAAWYPATHSVRMMIEDQNFAQTWYIFWILPMLFIGLNIFMVPTCHDTLYTGRILQIYIVLSLILLVILVLFYSMFLLMANSLNRNARLQQANHFLLLQQTRYDSLRTAIEEARQARHDMRHHFLQLSALAEQGDIEKIRTYLAGATSKIPNLTVPFCENQAADSVVGYYCALAGRAQIPFSAQIDLPARIPVDEIDMCLVLSNLLENALEASLRMESGRYIRVEVSCHFTHLLLIQVENAFAGTLQETNGIFRSSKRPDDGIGIQSVRRIAEKNGGDCSFTHEAGVFTARIMLRCTSI